MSTNSDNSELPETNLEKPEILQPQLPKQKIQSVLQELEIMAMQKGSRNNLDISKLDKGQIDTLLETVKENEKNAFAFHSKRIDAIKEIELKRIDASVINQKTKRVVLIGGVLFIVPLISILILLLKDTFFIPWITFMTGTFGGFGLSKASSGIFNPPQAKNPIKEDDDDE